ncbi:MAG: glutamine synthetase, partial [Halothiobacillus sp.]|nr:glutamine synthetase [Halothiobacillus sp.]
MIDRKNFSHKDMDQWLAGNNVTEIECLVPDLTGVARGKILPREKFTAERAMRLPEQVLGVTVTGESPENRPAYDNV